MSRIGKQPVNIPAGVTVNLDGDNLMTVKGPKGTLSQKLHPDMKINIEGNVMTVTRPGEEKQHKALHGLTRMLVYNMVTGVTKGFTKELDIVGDGYRVQKTGNQLVFTLGYSHKITVDEEPGVSLEAPTPTKIIVSGPDKQRIGQVAAEIRGFRKPEPYLGKGIKYSDERIRRKAGKSGKK